MSDAFDRCDNVTGIGSSGSSSTTTVVMALVGVAVGVAVGCKLCVYVYLCVCLVWFFFALVGSMLEMACFPSQRRSFPKPQVAVVLLIIRRQKARKIKAQADKTNFNNPLYAVNSEFKFVTCSVVGV